MRWHRLGKIWTGFRAHARALENMATKCTRIHIPSRARAYSVKIIFTSHIMIVFRSPEQRTERAMLKSAEVGAVSTGFQRLSTAANLKFDDATAVKYHRNYVGASVHNHLRRQWKNRVY